MINSIKDEIPYGRVSDDITNEEIVADYHSPDKLYTVCVKCGSVYKHNNFGGSDCLTCGANWGEHWYLCNKHFFMYRKYNQVSAVEKEPEVGIYLCFVDGKNAPQYEHRSIDEANKEADRLSQLLDNIGRKVDVLRLINTRTSKITIERS